MKSEYDRKLRVIVEIKPNPDKFPRNTKIFEGSFKVITHRVFEFLDDRFRGADSYGIGAVISAGTVPITASHSPGVSMQNLREFPHPSVPISADNLGEDELKLLRIIGLIDDLIPEK